MLSFTRGPAGSDFGQRGGSAPKRMAVSEARRHQPEKLRRRTHRLGLRVVVVVTMQIGADERAGSA
jgi:hypothetical protein